MKQNNTNIDLLKMPSDLLCERYVLGCVIVEGNLAELPTMLDESSFYDDFCRQVWTALLSLDKRDVGIDIITVTDELRRLGNDSDTLAYEVVRLTEAVGSAQNLESYARILQQKAMQRRLIEAGQKVSARGADNTEDIADILDSIVKLVDSLNSVGISTAISFEQALKLAYAEIKAAENNAVQSGLPGIATGVSSFDNHFGGLQPELTIVAGRPGMGKTSYALSLAYDIARQGKPVMFFSLEMSAAQLAKKVVSFHTGIPLENFIKAKMTGEEWTTFDSHVSVMSKMPLYFDDTAGIKVTDLRSRCRAYKEKYHVQAIFVDYLQLIEVSSANRFQTRDQIIGEISRTLKKINKELGVPVVVLSQLSREVEKRADKRPQLSDLRESGSIEQDADSIQFVYRPEYYGIMQYDDTSATTNDAEIIVAKNRNGKTGSFHLNFRGEQTYFQEWEQLTF